MGIGRVSRNKRIRAQHELKCYTTLKTKDLASKGMAGVIAFCATALERAITLISEGNIKVENILASTSLCSKLNIKLSKVLNKATGKETSTPYLFSHDLWGKENTGYMKSIKKKGLDFIGTTRLR
ncbi:uncharacterized protein F5147DRAFT_776734 [Suillus discolor]|uniref:Uncharacterized protein n=1 Tax=Suillus discolor TaxID=1912936 RepID=A0A9P7F2J5_9AGAM|nr:uncharacterized protein F5147DRAFT_776734 [Suillus discolor]KAG2101386.1 hypothetical protein F5147DRAFT_776734 [Suillus discolor]